MRQIDISTPKFPNTFAMVSDEDFESLSRHKWTACRPHKIIYAYRVERINGRAVSIKMHREIMGDSDLMVDHIDGNGINNQRSNLRFSTPMENSRNRHRVRGRSKFKGVSWHKRSGMWRATIVVNKKQVALGYFKEEALAASAYDSAAKQHFGDFARGNFHA